MRAQGITRPQAADSRHKTVSVLKRVGKRKAEKTAGVGGTPRAKNSARQGGADSKGSLLMAWGHHQQRSVGQQAAAPLETAMGRS
jgi:hypothetical protein